MAADKNLVSQVIENLWMAKEQPHLCRILQQVDDLPLVRGQESGDVGVEVEHDQLVGSDEPRNL